MSAVSVLPAPPRPQRALTVASTPPRRRTARRAQARAEARAGTRAEARAAEQVRACVVAVVLVGAIVTVPLMIVAVLVPALWSLPFLAAVHTPIFAVMAGHKLTRRLAATPG